MITLGHYASNIVQEKKRKWTKEYMLRRRADRLDYIHHYKRKKKGYTVTLLTRCCPNQHSFFIVISFLQPGIASIDRTRKGVHL